VNIVDESGEELVGVQKDIKAEITGPEKHNGEVSDGGSAGSYSISFTPRKEGDYFVAVYYAGGLLNGRAFIIRVVAEGFKGRISGENVIRFQLRFEARDNKMQLINNAAKRFIIKVTNPSGKQVESEVEESGSGFYILSFNAIEEGDYSCVIQLDGKTIVSQVVNPFKATQTRQERASGEVATADGSGKVICRWSFIVKAFDKNDRPLKGKVNLKVLGPDKELKVDVKEKEDGAYKISYEPKVRGEYSIYVYVNGQEIKGSPFTQTF